LSLVSRNGNVATYRDTTGRNQVVYTDPTTGLEYTRNSNGTRNYLNGVPVSTVGQPRTVRDTLNSIYSISSDPQGNQYITYSDTTGSYYLNSQGMKIYQNQPTQPTQPVQPVQPTRPVQPNVTNTEDILYSDPSGNKFLLNPTTSAREYLCQGTSRVNTPTYVNSGTGEEYPIMMDNAGNEYISSPDNTRTYLTGYPSQVSGSPTPVRDAVGDTYYVERDPQGNRYVTYVDQRGRYYINSNGNPSYLRTSNIPAVTPSPKNTPEWDLIRELQEKLASCGGRI
jgi:hypothetical protein